MSLSVIQIPVSGFDNNFSYLIVDEYTKGAALVDPSGEIERVFRVLSERSLNLGAILITHTHADHIERLHEVIVQYPIPVYIHERGVVNSSVPSELLHSVQDNDSIPFPVGGDADIMVLHTSGHSDDSVCFYIDSLDAYDSVPKLISGDTLFVEGCGRTTKEQVAELYASLQRLKTLPDDTELFPGHDYGSKPRSTIGQEKIVNKYLVAKDLDSFTHVRLPNTH